MTPTDLISTLLVVGFYSDEYALENENKNIAFVNTNKEEISFSVDLSYKFMWRWRYEDIRPYDMGVAILLDGCVLVLHEGKEPNYGKWEHYRVFNSPAEAWGFIRNFLQEHP